MKSQKNLNKKLMAMLLSMAMFITSIPQGAQAYAAELAKEAQETTETDESAVDRERD